MLGWKLFKRALMLIVENLGPALRVSLLPYGVAVAISLWVALRWPEWAGVMTLDPDMPPPGGFVAATLASGLVTIVASLWVAVGWHRYILMGEEPRGWVPVFHGNLILGYLGRSIIVGIVVLLIVLAVSTMGAVLLLPLFGPAAAPAVSAIGFFAAAIFFYRIGLILPAGTVEAPMRINAALVATKGQSGAIIILAFLTVGFSFALQIPTQLDGGAGVIDAVYQAVVGWIGLMLGVGTLTALYGYLIEGRPVD